MSVVKFEPLDLPIAKPQNDGYRLVRRHAPAAEIHYHVIEISNKDSGLRGMLKKTVMNIFSLAYRKPTKGVPIVLAELLSIVRILKLSFSLNCSD